MKKWLWRILLGVSSCLLVAVSILWVRSLTHHEGIEWRNNHWGNGIQYHCGGGVGSGARDMWFTTNYGHFPISEPCLKTTDGTELRWVKYGLGLSPGRYQLSPLATGDGTYWWNSLGFFAQQTRSSNELSYWRSIQVPHWFLVALFSIPLLIQCRRWYIRRGRYKTGLCQACGYDLRASVDRCPECGTAMKLSGAAAAAENPSST